MPADSLRIRPSGEHLLIRRVPGGGFVLLYSTGELPARRVRPEQLPHLVCHADLDRAVIHGLRNDWGLPHGPRIHPECLIDPAEHDLDVEELAVAFDAIHTVTSGISPARIAAPVHDAAATAIAVARRLRLRRLLLLEWLHPQLTAQTLEQQCITVELLDGRGVTLEDLRLLCGEQPDRHVHRILAEQLDGQTVHTMAVLYTTAPHQWHWDQLRVAATRL